MYDENFESLALNEWREGAVSQENDEKYSRSMMISRCQHQLQSLCSHSDSFTFASLATVDGRSLCHVSSNSDSRGVRISAISSSLMALSDAFSREVSNSPARYTTISGDHGIMILVRVPTETGAHILAVGSDSTQILALSLRWTLDTAEALAKILA